MEDVLGLSWIISGLSELSPRWVSMAEQVNNKTLQLLVPAAKKALAKAIMLRSFPLLDSYQFHTHHTQYFYYLLHIPGKKSSIFSIYKLPLG